MTEDVRIGEVITKAAVLEARLDGHEDECAKRYGEIATKLSTIESRMTGALVALVLILLGALGTVLYAGAKGMQVERVQE